MTLTQLRYVMTIAKTGSMNRAAKSLYVSQPSLSKAIKELETEIGQKLFHRTSRGIMVTPDGEEFLGYAAEVINPFATMEKKYIFRK